MNKISRKIYLSAIDRMKDEEFIKRNVSEDIKEHMIEYLGDTSDERGVHHFWYFEIDGYPFKFTKEASGKISMTFPESIKGKLNSFFLNMRHEKKVPKETAQYDLKNGKVIKRISTHYVDFFFENKEDLIAAKMPILLKAVKKENGIYLFQTKKASIDASGIPVLIEDKKAYIDKKNEDKIESLEDQANRLADPTKKYEESVVHKVQQILFS